jgi:hypothetical protein
MAIIKPDRSLSRRERESALRLAERAAISLEPLLVASGVGVDVDDVAVLGEAVDEGAEAGGIAEDDAPLLVREIGRDHDWPGFVPLAHDAEEEVGAAKATVKELGERNLMKNLVKKFEIAALSTGFRRFLAPIYTWRRGGSSRPRRG